MFLKKMFLTLSLLVLLTEMLVWSQSQEYEESSHTVDYRNFRNEPEFRKEIIFSHIDIKKLNEVIIHLTNEIRVKNNLNPLSYSPELEKSAQMHANDMVSGNFFSHINEKVAKKKTPNDRAKLNNIANPFLAENLIEGYALRYTSNEPVYLRGKGKFSATPEGDLIKAHTYLSFGETQVYRWMHSKDHRKNILAKEALQIGCGAATFTNPEFNDMPSLYVVQNFQWYQPVRMMIP